MNAGIVILKDGTPCIAYDEALPHPIRHVEFDPEDYQVTLVYEIEGKPESREGRKFAFPLDHAILARLKELEHVAIAMMKDNTMAEFKIYPFVFNGNEA
ncbi:MAG: hypothetical protein GC185_06595 [Alphaproteobacteria bacterium]|nr:hypothetical protein [Alphaproteobacteria bacterium]